MNVVFLGAPGSGKGTQAKLLEASHGFVQLSTGDMLRGEIARETELGKTAKTLMDRGQLVSDNLVIQIIKSKLSDPSLIGKSVIFDGFPRTVAQGESLVQLFLEIGQKLDRVFYFRVEESVVLDRLTGRRSCEKCGAVYHVVTKPTAKKGICDSCGGVVSQRKDDTEEVIKNRLHVYSQQTSPLIAFFESKGLLKTLNAVAPTEEVYKSIVSSF